ncbi:MAG: cytochrome P450 [Solirubrobacteraceae bacterium]|nr:cytochrome P450 [Solirubrobacteraceae bacterium]
MTTTTEQPIETIDLGDMRHWRDGPPHALFDRLRAEAPVHWSPMATWPGESGFWSVTTADLIHEVSRDWETFSSERSGILAVDHYTPVEVQNAMFIGMDPPRHDRIKALFQRGFTPKRIAEHEPEIRAIATRVLDQVMDRDEIELIEDVAQPIVGRVIGGFLGTPESDDAAWAQLANQGLGFGDEELQPQGAETAQEVIGEVLQRALALAAERREHPTGDLTSLLVHAEVDGQRLEDYEIAFGFGLLVAAGNDSTKATYSNGMLALLRDRPQMQKLIDDPSRIPAAVEEFLRMYPAFAHFRRTATRDVELGGQLIREDEKVLLWYPSGNRDEAVYTCPHQLDVERNPEHQAFGAGGRHFCLGTALARLELAVMFEETLRRFPNMELLREPEAVRSIFLNQPRTLPVRLRP